MLKPRNIEKCFKTKAGFTYVLRQINLDIAAGEFVTIMGPSGAGKSILLGILGMYYHAWDSTAIEPGLKNKSFSPRASAGNLMIRAPVGPVNVARNTAGSRTDSPP